MKKFVILFAAALFAANSAFARLNTIEMTSHEQMFNACGTFQKLAELIDLEVSSVLIDMLKVAQRRGATDAQLSLLKMEFESGQRSVTRHGNRMENKEESKRQNEADLKEFIGYCRVLSKDG